MLADRLAAFGDAPALITADEVVTYADLAARVSALAARLGTERRLVLVEGGNDVPHVVAYLAALAGRHPVLLSAPGTPMDALDAAYDPGVVVRGDEVEDRGTRHDLHPDLALLLSTSGTTGSPKVVRLSYENVDANAESIATYLGISASDRAATTLPMHYCYGLSVVNSHLLRGAALILTDLSVVDPCFWRLFREHGGTTFAGVPYTFDLLDRAGFADMDLPTLRYVTQAGGRLDPERVRRYATMGDWDLFVMYGQTEATARMAYLPPHLAATHPDAVGVPVPGGAFAIEDGELVYTGPNVMLGYATGPADLSLGRTVDRLHTGDLAEVRDGLYRVVGRRSRFAKVFGLRIDLERVEAVVENAAVTERDDRLVVAVAGRHDLDEVRHAVAAFTGLPPRAVETRAVNALPRLCGGKVDYAAVRALPPSPAQRLAGARDLRRVYADVLERDDVTDDSTFVGLGGDSLSYVELSLRVEQELGHLPPAWHVTPIRDLAATPAAKPRRTRSVETSVVLRAVAIVVVVASHANLFDVVGGAHALLAVAGYNYARFHLTPAGLADRTRHALRSVARIALPSMVWIGGVLALTGQYGLPNVVLLNGVLGPNALGPTWQFWFVEALVWTVLALTLVLGPLHRVERRAPFWLAMGFVGLGLLGRYGVVPVGGSDRYYTAHVVFWLFALGWATAKATTVRHRLLVTAVTVGSVSGFFGWAAREQVVIGAMLLLTWLPTVRLPKPLVRPTGALAGASLYVYLVHWQVFPHLQWRSPILATVLSLAAGVVVWRVWESLPQHAKHEQQEERQDRRDGERAEAA